MSTFSGMVTRDLYKQYVSPDASDSVQKLCGRIFVIVVTVVALFVAAQFTGAIVMLGGLAVAYGFQMYPALLGVCYFPWLTRKGVVWGLVAGLIAVTLTDRTVAVFGLPWGAFPLTIHSAGWGIFANLIICPARLEICFRKQRRTRKPQKTPRIHPGGLWPHRRPKKMGDTGVDPHRCVVPRWIRTFCHHWQHPLFRSQYPGNMGTLWFALDMGLATSYAALRHLCHVDARLQSRPLQAHSHRRCDLAAQSVF